MAEQSTHHSFVIVDIEGFGRRSDEDQKWLRQQMYAVLRAAFADADIHWESCRTQDRGDSVILLVPATVPKRKITDALVHRLDRELTAYARRAAEPVRMRMRLALHAGEVAADDQGWVGTDLNTACRLVDLPASRAALAAAADVNLVLIVSDSWFRGVVMQDPVLVEHFGFERVPFVAKEVDDVAWIHVPGVGRTATAAATATAMPMTPTPTTIGFQFNGPAVVDNAVMGDQTNFHGSPRRQP